MTHPLISRYRLQKKYKTPTGIGIRTQDGAGLGAIYDFTIASEELMVRILEWFVRGRTFQWYLDVVRNPTQKQRSFLTMAMRYAPAHLLGEARRARAHNLVPLLIRSEIATLISGTSITPTLKANYLALGDGTTAAAPADVQLGNETLRGTFDDRSATSYQAFLDKFFTSGDVGGNTYHEAGIYIDGDVGADTGYLLSRVLLDATLGSNETLTINCTFSVNAA